MIIIYEQINQPVAIINLAEGFSIDEAIKQIPENTRFRIVNETELPANAADFTDALSIDFNNNLDPNIHIDIEKAREITKNRLRKERIPYFVKIDIAIRDAMIENNAEKLKEAVEERDRLRDITMSVVTVNTVEQLRRLAIKK
jgi:hypothetical protein